MGGGSGACGLITVRNALGATREDHRRRRGECRRACIDPGRAPNESSASPRKTFAEGIATRVSFDLPFSIYKQYLDDFVLLTEEELAEGVRMALKTTHNLPEGAGSASIAAAYKLRRTTSPGSASSASCPAATSMPRN